MSDTASGRPWQLDDRGWLAARYAQVGDTVIARELQVQRLTVRRARVRLGIQSAEPGRRRGSLTVAPPAGGSGSGTVTFTGTLRQLIERFHREVKKHLPGTEDLLIARIRAAHDAKQAGDQLAYEDALLGIASAACLIHQHQRRLRGAAA